MVANAQIIALTDMNFAQRLLALRKDRSLTQAALAERVGIHVSNVRRYEAGELDFWDEKLMFMQGPEDLLRPVIFRWRPSP